MWANLLLIYILKSRTPIEWENVTILSIFLSSWRVWIFFHLRRGKEISNFWKRNNFISLSYLVWMWSELWACFIAGQSRASLVCSTKWNVQSTLRQRGRSKLKREKRKEKKLKCSPTKTRPVAQTLVAYQTRLAQEFCSVCRLKKTCRTALGCVSHAIGARILSCAVYVSLDN